MVFKGYIPVDIRASVFQLRRNTDMSIRQIAKVCGISPATATRVLKVGKVVRTVGSFSSFNHCIFYILDL